MNIGTYEDLNYTLTLRCLDSSTKPYENIMARPKKNPEALQIKEVALADARRVLARKRGRGSRFDPLLALAEKLAAGRALQVDELPYSQVLGLRKKVKAELGEGWKVDSTKVGELYDVILYRSDEKE